MRRYNQGWKAESERHSLARRGVKTGKKIPHNIVKSYKFEGFMSRNFANALPSFTEAKDIDTGKTEYIVISKSKMVYVYDNKKVAEQKYRMLKEVS